MTTKLDKLIELLEDRITVHALNGKSEAARALNEYREAALAVIEAPMPDRDLDIDEVWAEGDLIHWNDGAVEEAGPIWAGFTQRRLKSTSGRIVRVVRKAGGLR